MGWSIGYDNNHKRDIGYGVPAVCDHPDCNAEIHRGLAYVCGDDVYGGEHGCGLFFCGSHRGYWGDEDVPVAVCERCSVHADPFEPKTDTAEWVEWKLTDESWAPWRAENPEWVSAHNPEVDEETTSHT